MAKRKIGTRQKFSDLVGENIEVDVYADDDSQDDAIIDGYRVQADLGHDVIARINDGYTIIPTPQ